MEPIEVKNIKELNYSICSYILRKRLNDCIIQCEDKPIIENLEIYMTEIGIPWSQNAGKGIVFHCNEEIEDSMRERIIITCDSERAICYKENEKIISFFLRDIEKEEIESIAVSVEKFDIDSIPMHLQNEEIRKMFLKAFIMAETEIDIISPWMNFSVVNNSLIELMRQALQRGVIIRIIYGLLPGSDEYNQIRSDRSDQVARRLSDMFADYGDAFRITRDNIHYKLVLCDEKFKLEGGFNYLSFTGDYSNPDTRKEGSPFGRDNNEIRYLRKEYFRNDSME